MTTETMTVSELIEWAENQGSREAIDAILVYHGLINDSGVYASEINDHTEVEITWPDHARIHRPNGDILAVRVATLEGVVDDHAAYKWAASEQGFTGTYADWQALPAGERAKYEDGAAGVGTA